MKNATKHADDLRTLFKKLMKEHKPEPRQPMDALSALVRGAMSYDMPDARASEAMAIIAREFVDLNELRVATELEIHELLGTRYPAIEKRVAIITQTLNLIFEKEHTLSLDRLKALPKRDARQVVRDFPAMHSFVEAYMMLFAFDGHAVPIDDQVLSYLRGHGLVEQETTLEEAQRFVEHAIKAEESYDLYTVLRRAAQGDGAPATVAKKKAKV